MAAGIVEVTGKVIDMGTLIALIVIAIVFGLLFWALQQLPLPAPFGQVARVLLILVFVLWLLGVLFGGLPLPTLRVQ